MVVTLIVMVIMNECVYVDDKDSGYDDKEDDDDGDWQPRT